MAQQIIQNGEAVMASPENVSCAIIFRNLTGVNLAGREYRNYLAMMLHDFPRLTYGGIELWEDGKLISKGTIKK